MCSGSLVRPVTTLGWIFGRRKVKLIAQRDRCGNVLRKVYLCFSQAPLSPPPDRPSPPRPKIFFNRGQQGLQLWWSLYLKWPCIQYNRKKGQIQGPNNKLRYFLSQRCPLRTASQKKEEKFAQRSDPAVFLTLHDSTNLQCTKISIKSKHTK